MAKKSAGPLGEAQLSDELDLAQSAAGEEDPGAAIDLAQAAARPRKAAQPAVTPGTGEGVCPNCGGSGRAANGACLVCGGTGTVAAGTGGA